MESERSQGAFTWAETVSKKIIKNICYNFVFQSFVLGMRKLWRSIVMSTSVFVSVCLSAVISLEPYARSFCECCLWPWFGPLPAGWRNPKGEGAILGVFFPINSALYSIAFDPYKNGWTDRDAVSDEDLGQSNHVLEGSADPSRGSGNFAGVVRAIPTHCQSSLQRSLQHCCKRDNSIANNAMQQKGSLSIPGKRK